jgi:hypothetical protein
MWGEDVIKAKTRCDDNYIVTCVVLDGKIVLLISLQTLITIKMFNTALLLKYFWV